MMQSLPSTPENESEHVSIKPSTKDRRTQDRRQTECEGFVYIPMVGWYCRRDHTRRNDDTMELATGKEKK